MHRHSVFLALVVLLALSRTALAEPAAVRAVSRPWSVRALAVVVQPDEGLPAQLGLVVDVRLRRGNVGITAGGGFATTPNGDAGGHIRGEGSANYHLGPIYVGMGGALGTLSVETPNAGSEKWAGAAATLHAQVGGEFALGRRGLCVQLRGGTTFPYSSIVPGEEIPDNAGRHELTASAGVMF